MSATFTQRTSGPIVPADDTVPRPLSFSEAGDRVQFAIVDSWLDREGHDLTIELLEARVGGTDGAAAMLETWRKRWEQYRDKRLEELAR